MTFPGRCLLLLLAALMTSCGQQQDAKPRASAPASQAPFALQGPAAGMTRQEAFLARIKGAAAGNGVITDARMNRDNELGVVLGPDVKLNRVRDLMTTLLREMRSAFPGRPLMVIAYAPNGKQMATMHYDPSAPANANVVYRPDF
jgi:hypothetical protein